MSRGREARLPRILHVSEAFGGGVQEMVTTLSERLQAAGYPVAIAYGRRPETPVDVRERIAPGVELFSLGWERRTLPEQARACRRLRRLVEAWRPDVVHLHSSFAGLVGAAALAGLDLPSVYTPHGYSFTMGDQSPARRRAFRLAERLTARRATVVVTVSEAEAAAARTVAPAAKVRVVRNGIPELDECDSAAPPAPRPDPPRVIAMGRVTPAHLPFESARLLAAVADLAAVEWVGGAGAGEIPVSAITDQGVPISGWVDRPTALAKLAEATVLLHWTGWDGLPLSVLEAMASDVVVIGHDIPAVREIVGPGQVRATEAEGRELLRRTLTEPGLREEMLAEQRRRRPAYGAARMTADWRELYDSLLAIPADRAATPPRPARAGDDAAAHAAATRGR
ncbi:MAG TPA: glycosyltransferase family 4 protein [Solirubrobacterales bacterium]|nr:glycosyltransferase family 4 protein [Solirubrobacterales bacterium]